MVKLGQQNSYEYVVQFKDTRTLYGLLRLEIKQIKQYYHL